MWYEHLGPLAIFWVAIVAIVFVGNFFSYRERANRYRMIETLAEKGQPIPPEYLSGYNTRRYWRYGHPVASGIYLMCVGVAITLFFWALTGWGNPFDEAHSPSWLPILGIFPFMIGVARVLAGIIDRPPPK